jgi:hypothetical protein
MGKIATLSFNNKATDVLSIGQFPAVLRSDALVDQVPEPLTFSWVFPFDKSRDFRLRFFNAPHTSGDVFIAHRRYDFIDVPVFTLTCIALGTRAFAPVGGGRAAIFEHIDQARWDEALVALGVVFQRLFSGLFIAGFEMPLQQRPLRGGGVGKKFPELAQQLLGIVSRQNTSETPEKPLQKVQTHLASFKDGGCGLEGIGHG